MTKTYSVYVRGKNGSRYYLNGANRGSLGFCRERVLEWLNIVKGTYVIERCDNGYSEEWSDVWGPARVEGEDND